MADIYRNYTREVFNQPIGWTFPILSIYSSEPRSGFYEKYFHGADVHVMEVCTMFCNGNMMMSEKNDRIKYDLPFV